MGEELQAALQRVSNTTFDAQGAANSWAGTTGLDLVGALNTKAGNARTDWKDLEGVLRQLMRITAADEFDLSDLSASVGLKLPGTAGNYASSADSVLNSPTGDIDIRVCAKLDDWTPAALASFVVKWAANNRSYRLQVAAGGALVLSWATDGQAGTVVTKTSSVATGIVDGALGWVRGTLDVDNGSGSNEVKFYTSSDGVTWTQLGTTQTTSGVTSVYDGSINLALGADSGGAIENIAGTIYYAEIRNGIDGPVAAKFDASTVSSSGAQLPAAINGWTVNGSALYRRDDYVRVPGTGSWLSYPDTVANSVVSDLDVRCKVALDDWTPAAIGAVFGKTAIGLRGWRVLVTTAGFLEFRWSADGTNEIIKTSTSALNLIDGTVKWLRVTLDVDNGAAGNDVKFYMSDDGTTWAQLGTTVTTAGVTSIADTSTGLGVGASGSDGSNVIAGNYYAAEVRNGIGGEVVASFDARDITTPWTVNGTGWSWEGASFAGKPVTALSLPGTAGNYASQPDAAGTSVVSDIDIRVKAALDDWTPAAQQTLLSKYTGTGNQRAYWLYILATGVVVFQWSADGTTAIAKSSTANLATLADGAVKWVRATLDVDNGATGNDVKFYTSDDGITWTQLGATVTTAAVTSIFDNTTEVQIGAQSGSDRLAGKVYYAEVRNGIDGPIVARFDPTAIARTGVRTPATTVQPGGTPNLLTPNQASIETDTTGWTNNTNATLTRSTVAGTFLDGVASLSMAATAVGSTIATTTPITTAPVVPGKSYTARASFKAATVARAARTYIFWYTAASGFISSIVGQTNDATGSWTEVTVTGVAPATAAFAVAGVGINDGTQLAAEIHFVDRVSIVESAATWTMNGAAWDLVQV